MTRLSASSTKDDDRECHVVPMLTSLIRPLPAIAALIAVLLTMLVQEWIRPQLAGTPYLALLGTAPSFLYAAAGVLAAASVRDWPPSYRWWAASGPFLYELLQPWIDGRTFDVADLLASVLGALLAIALTRQDASGR